MADGMARRRTALCNIAHGSARCRAREARFRYCGIAAICAS